MKQGANEVLFGLYDDEEILLNAVKQAKADHLDIMDVYTPFPVHGLDPILGLSESRLHVAGFIYGAIGCLFGFLFMTWVFTRDWPIIFGGKPYFSAPAFGRRRPLRDTSCICASAQHYPRRYGGFASRR